jgi:hypothetical protein
MSPLATELIQLFWPAIWSGLLGAAALWQRAQMARLDSICRTLEDFKVDVQIIKGEIASDREKERHRIDTLIGATNARFAAIESGCAIYHGTKHRRVTDPEDWAQTSDVTAGVAPPGK